MVLLGLSIAQSGVSQKLWSRLRAGGLSGALDAKCACLSRASLSGNPNAHVPYCSRRCCTCPCGGCVSIHVLPKCDSKSFASAHPPFQALTAAKGIILATTMCCSNSSFSHPVNLLTICMWSPDSTGRYPLVIFWQPLFCGCCLRAAWCLRAVCCSPGPSLCFLTTGKPHSRALSNAARAAQNVSMLPVGTPCDVSVCRLQHEACLVWHA